MKHIKEIMIMEKHPIDDLFARKLYGVTREPSKEIWQRLQRERKVNTQPVFFRPRWLAAAAVAMVLIAGGVRYSWQTSTTVQLAKVESGTKAQKMDKEIVAGSNSNSELNKREIGVISDKGAVKANEDEAREVISNDYPPVVSASSSESITIEDNKFDTEQISIENPTVQAVRSEAVNELSHAPKVTELMEAIDTEVKNEPSRVVVVHVAVDKEEVDRPNRFRRMLKQLQNAKDGEKVDWEEMGINTKKIFAHAGKE